jgi:CubicO group peptidase (beta-lactamase class C family)
MLPHGSRIPRLGLALAACLALAAPAAGQAPAPPADARVARIDSLVRAFHAAGRFSGAVLVGEGGRVLYEGGAGEANREWHLPNGPAVRYRIASTTKQFTAALVLQLWEEGRLELDAPVAAYLPEYPRPQGDRVTLHHLLTHSSGIPSYVGLPDFYASIGRTEHTPAELVALTSSLPLEFEPGSRWSYSNSGYVLLGLVIERVAGKPYEQVLRERILAPLGLEDTGYDRPESVVERRASGYVPTEGGYANAPFLDPSAVYSAGMLRSTVRDLFRWDRALRGGRVFRRPATAARMFTGHVDTGVPLGRYGYGWFVGEGTFAGRKVGVVQHGGTIPGFTAGFWRMDDGRTIVVLDNTMSPAVAELQRALAEIVYAGGPP